MPQGIQVRYYEMNYDEISWDGGGGGANIKIKIRVQTVNYHRAAQHVSIYTIIFAMMKYASI